MNTRLRLGKLPATRDKRDLLFRNYLTGKLPTPPKQFGHENLISDDLWQMLGNGPDDSVAPGFQGAGDCVFAGACHETMLWTREGGQPATFTGANAIAAYSKVTGYNPKTGANDNGTDVRTALKFRQKTGIQDSSGVTHKIGAFLAIEPGNFTHVLQALYLFGAVGLGIQFPSSAMDQFNANEPWAVTKGSSIEGGHYIPLVASRSTLECVTWGRTQLMTTAFFSKYCDEAYAILSPEMLHAGMSPEGFDLAQLQADLALVGH